MPNYRRTFSILPLLLVFVFAACAGCGLLEKIQAPASQPGAAKSPPADIIIIPAGPGSFTQQKFCDVSLQYHRRLIPQAYQQNGIKNPSWDKPALALLEKYAAVRAYKADISELSPLVKPLLTSGCADPMVNYTIGVSLMAENRNAEARPFVEKAVNAFAGKYSRAVTWGAPIRLADLYRQQGGDQAAQAATLDVLGIRWLGEGAAKENFGPREAPVFWDTLVWYLNDRLRKFLPDIYQAVKSNPSRDPWLVDLIGGRYEIKEAWKARGGGWAREVTEEGWQGFYEHLAKAREHLTAAWKLHPDYPEPAGEMITVVMGEGAKARDTERLWFNRAVAAQMDFEPAYADLAWALAPRWGGSVREMYDFGVTCLETERYDTPAPMWFYHMVWRIANDKHGGDPKIWQRPEVYEKLTTLCQGMLASPSRAEEQNWIKSFWVTLAWRCGEFQDARRLMEELGKDFQSEQFKHQFNVEPKKALAEIYAAGSTNTK